MKFKNIKKRLKNSVLNDTYKCVRKNLKLYGMTLIMDALFLIVLYFLSILVKSALPDSVSASLYTKFGIPFILSVNLLYFLLIIFAYSFFKFVILKLILGIFKKTKFEFKKIDKFFLMNVMTAAVIFLITTILTAFISGSVRDRFSNGALVFMLLVIGFFSYSFVNASHSLFVREMKLRKSIKGGLDFTFKKIPKYLPVIGFSAGALVIYSLVFAIIGVVLNSIFLINYDIYKIIFNAITLILLYLIIAFNRIYFYLVVKNVLP